MPAPRRRDPRPHRGLRGLLPRDRRLSGDESGAQVLHALSSGTTTGRSSKARKTLPPERRHGLPQRPLRGEDLHRLEAEGQLLQHEGKDPPPHGAHRQRAVAAMRAVRRGAPRSSPSGAAPTEPGSPGSRAIPCPNLCTGGANFHGVHEFVPVAAMEKMVQVLVELVRC